MSQWNEAVEGLLRDIQRNMAIGEPNWSGIETRIERALRRPESEDLLPGLRWAQEHLVVGTVEHTNVHNMIRDLERAQNNAALPQPSPEVAELLKDARNTAYRCRDQGDSASANLIDKLAAAIKRMLPLLEEAAAALSRNASRVTEEELHTAKVVVAAEAMDRTGLLVTPDRQEKRILARAVLRMAGKP